MVAKNSCKAASRIRNNDTHSSNAQINLEKPQLLIQCDATEYGAKNQFARTNYFYVRTYVVMHTYGRQLCVCVCVCVCVWERER